MVIPDYAILTQEEYIELIDALNESEDMNIDVPSWNDIIEKLRDQAYEIYPNGEF